MKNRVRELREKAGLSRVELARAAGVTAAIVQRIENEKQAAALPHAIAICGALGKSLNVVFPGSQKFLNALQADPAYVSELWEKLRQTGIEADPRSHVLKIILRGHRQPMFFNVSPEEKARVFQVVQHERANDDEEPFIVFDTPASTVAINLRRLSFCHFLWDAGWLMKEDETAEQDRLAQDDTRHQVVLYLNEDETPLTFEAEPESSDFEDGDIGDFACIFSMLQDGCPPSDRLHFEDADGEDAFIRVGDITLLEVPIFVLDHEEREAISEDEDEDDDADNHDSPPPPRGQALSLVKSHGGACKHFADQHPDQ
ncbi:XRE family transcriptional regulator [Herbaspirillum sp. HC18]|nr:XRE family transcriptional regulator [Herbaspirillum sp. HC18]